MDVDTERQGPKNDGTGSEKKTTIKRAIGLLTGNWDVAFLVVCVVAVAADPLFFYLPFIDESTKCIKLDTTLEIIAICVRSFLDLIAIWYLIARKKIHDRPDMKCSDYVINILSILPVPQVLVPIIFSEMRNSEFRDGRKFLNAVVLLQYLPRIFRIYRLWKIVNKNIKPGPKVNAERNKNTKGFMVMKAGFNLFLYLVASHVLGAFWYFFSIERETTCWHMGCKPDAGCSKTSFNCGHGSSSDTTILNKFCSLENPNTTLFDFGIFQEARQSRILESMDFPRKTIFCFWWGLRNLSSFGQNLETSSYYWENCFTVLISIFGLLLFLYFIGNLQVYMQWEAQKEMEELSMHKPSKEVKETSKHKHDAISKQTSKERNEISKEHDEISKLLKVIYKEHDEISKLLEVIYKEHDDISKLLEVISKEHNEISKLLKIRPLPPVAPQVYMQWEAQKEMKDIYEDKKDEISKEHDEISKLVEASDI